MKKIFIILLILLSITISAFSETEYNGTVFEINSALDAGFFLTLENNSFTSIPPRFTFLIENSNLIFGTDVWFNKNLYITLFNFGFNTNIFKSENFDLHWRNYLKGGVFGGMGQDFINFTAPAFGLTTELALAYKISPYLELGCNVGVDGYLFILMPIPDIHIGMSLRFKE